MKRGQKTRPEQVVLMLRQIEVQTAQGKSLALACKEAKISGQKLKDECLKQEIFYSLKEAQTVIGPSGRTPTTGSGRTPRGPSTARACHLPGPVFRLPMPFATQKALTQLGPKYRSGQRYGAIDVDPGSTLREIADDASAGRRAFGERDRRGHEAALTHLGTA